MKRLARAMICLGLVLVGCRGQAPDAPIVERPDNHAVDVWFSNYYTVYEAGRYVDTGQRLNGRKDSHIFIDGKRYTCSAAFALAAAIEGHAIALDGNGIAYARPGKTAPRYRPPYGQGPHYQRAHANAPEGKGRGRNDYPLVAFRSVAVAQESSRVPQDRWIFCPTLVGALLPDGRKHDGYLMPVDVGAALQPDQLDLFVGRFADFVQEHWEGNYRAYTRHANTPVSIWLTEHPIRPYAHGSPPSPPSD